LGMNFVLQDTEAPARNPQHLVQTSHYLFTRDERDLHTSSDICKRRLEFFAKPFVDVRGTTTHRRIAIAHVWDDLQVVRRAMWQIVAALTPKSRASCLMVLVESWYLARMSCTWSRLNFAAGLRSPYSF